MNLYAFETDRNLDFINFEVPKLVSIYKSTDDNFTGFQISAFWVFLAKKLLVPLCLRFL